MVKVFCQKNYEGGKGGASIYADFSANEILTNEITLICGITNTQSDPLMYSSMEISNTNTLWTWRTYIEYTGGW